MSSRNILHRVICKRWGARSTGFVCMFAIYICVKGRKSSFYQMTAANSHLVFSILVFTSCAIWMRSDIQNLSLTNGHRFPEFFSIECFFISGCSWARQIHTIHTLYFSYIPKSSSKQSRLLCCFAMLFCYVVLAIFNWQISSCTCTCMYNDIQLIKDSLSGICIWVFVMLYRS